MDKEEPYLKQRIGDDIILDEEHERYKSNRIYGLDTIFLANSRADRERLVKIYHAFNGLEESATV